MCGIVGSIGLGSFLDKSLFERQVDSMLSRGPDDRGSWYDDAGQFAMGSRRLAIHDLSDNGHMPMVDPGGRVLIVHNGEIYNYKEIRAQLQTHGVVFASDSDTEVILKAYIEWGPDCIDKLDGMFAFAILDLRKGIENFGLLLARDRLGEKPLYYIHSAGRLSFASTLDALLLNPSVNRRLDLDVFAACLENGYGQTDRSLVRDIHKLPPGNCLVFEAGKPDPDVRAYWSVPEYDDKEVVNRGELVERFIHELEKSVTNQLAADVPVGILLSGGVDSSLVTAVAARVSSSPVKTFTITFPRHPRFDEGAYARKVADYFGTDHHELPVDQLLSTGLREMAGIYDEPVFDPSIFPTFMVSNLIREHVTVALGGDGGDELFGGYRWYQNLLRRRAMFGKIPYALRRGLGTAAAALLPGKYRNSSLLETFTADFGNQATFGRQPFLDSGKRRQILQRVGGDGDAGNRMGLTRGEAGGPVLVDPLQLMTRWDIGSYFCEDILVKTDRASMAVSLEMRSPFLSSSLVEFAMKDVPSSHKCNPDERKILLKEATELCLYPDFDADRKQGFTPPIAAWVEGHMKQEIVDLLGAPGLQLLSSVEVRDYAEGRSGYSAVQLFGLGFMQAWITERGITA